MAHVVAATVSLPLGASLDVNDRTIYTVVDWAPGGRTHRKTKVEGNYTAGHTTTGTVRGTETSTLIVKVEGSTPAALAASIATLFDAFSQFAYELTMTINGVTETRACDAAEINNVKGRFDKHAAARARPAQTYAITFEHQPV